MASQFKTRDAESYDALAARFDELSERYAAPFADRMARILDPFAAQRILDVGCGSGLLTRRLSAKCVAGVDLSAGMLARASKTCPRARFALCDAERLPFADGSFNAVVSLFALLHFPKPETCLRECFRALRPSGLLLLGFGSGPNALSLDPLRAAWREMQAGVIPGMARSLTAPETLDAIVRTRLPASTLDETTEIARTGSPGRSQRIVNAVREAGFRSVKLDWDRRVFVIPSIDEFWDLQAVFSSFARKRLADADPTQREAVRAEFHDRCQAMLQTGGKLLYRSAARFVTAQRYL